MRSRPGQVNRLEAVGSAIINALDISNRRESGTVRPSASAVLRNDDRLTSYAPLPGLDGTSVMDGSATVLSSQRCRRLSM